MDGTLETLFHDAHEKPNAEVCTSNKVPNLTTHDIFDKLNDQEWTRSKVQRDVHQAKPRVSKELTEVINRPGNHILNLPDEILLLVIKNLYEGSDKPSLFAFFVLRQVSRKFRGLMRGNIFLSHVFSDRGCCEWCTGGHRGKWTRINPSPFELHCFQTKVRKAGADITGLGALIRMGRISKTCRPEFESRRRTGVSPDCKFAALTSQDWMYCCACKVEHPTLCFSSEEVLKRSDRVCIARKGYIRLCAHEVLSWDQLKVSLGDNASRGFRKVCKHASHYFHQNDGRQLPIAVAEGNKDSFYLYLSSGFHSKALDKSHCESDGKNDYIGYHNHLLPLGIIEMAGEFQGKSQRIHNEKVAGQTVAISCDDCSEDHECLQLSYRLATLPTVPGQNFPRHSWFHAVSPESYSYDGPSGVPETCFDPLCQNYYSSGLRYWDADYRNRSGCN
ncbi:hypothetical protein FACUT_8387 [Fusarium acutatum]|uniref:F-box domain-containing protein n=1 Tax=Fusarium acutatum TaxID=78861 RepID=A0A8H4NJ86_9HYPO|nr:hypothetical protein FACUT_8387 [Fusarium acutatum]